MARQDEITSMFKAVRDEVYKQWPEGEEAPLFERLLSESKELFYDIASNFYGNPVDDKKAAQAVIKEWLGID